MSIDEAVRAIRAVHLQESISLRQGLLLRAQFPVAYRRWVQQEKAAVRVLFRKACWTLPFVGAVLLGYHGYALLPEQPQYTPSETVTHVLYDSTFAQPLQEWHVLYDPSFAYHAPEEQCSPAMRKTKHF